MFSGGVCLLHVQSDEELLLLEAVEIYGAHHSTAQHSTAWRSTAQHDAAQHCQTTSANHNTAQRIAAADPAADLCGPSTQPCTV